MTDYQNAKNNCPNLKTKFLFHGTSTEASSKIITTNFLNAREAWYGPGVYMTDMLDYAGFYAFTNPNNKFANHGKIKMER